MPRSLQTIIDEANSAYQDDLVQRTHNEQGNAAPRAAAILVTFIAATLEDLYDATSG